jgi:fatty-acyl-CoA synthase
MTADPTLFPTLVATVGRAGEREAFVGPGERVSWHAMLDEVRAIARGLLALGVRKGDHVGVLLGNGARWEQLFFACGAIGAVTVPISTRFKRDELAYCLAQADVSLLVFADRFLDIDLAALVVAAAPAVASGLPGPALPRLRHAVMLGEGRCPAGVLPFDALLARGTSIAAAALDDAVAAVAADDLLLIQFTSGTTAHPKGAMLTHAGMLRNAMAAAQRMGVRPDDRYFSIRPFTHVAGSTLSILVSLVTGCCLLTLPRFDVAETLRVLADERCTLISGNDTIFQMLMGHPRFDAGSLVLRGGWAAASPEVMRAIRETMRVPRMCNAYGLSEASPNVTLSSCDDPPAVRDAGLGLPHPGVELAIADPATGAPLPAGEVGEIRVRGWNVMRGYYGMPEQTAKALTADGWLRTGDLGALDGEGRLRFVGRLKDVFRVGGENVAPAEVEAVLNAHPSVMQSQVVGVPDARLGEVPAAFVVPRPGTSLSEDEIVGWCRSRCANFKVPRYVGIVDTFESIGMTASAKVQKHRLREHAIERFGLAGTPR